MPHVTRHTSHVTRHLIKLPRLMEVCSVGKEKVKPRAKVSACARSQPTVTNVSEYRCRLVQWMTFGDEELLDGSSEGAKAKRRQLIGERGCNVVI